MRFFGLKYLNNKLNDLLFHRNYIQMTVLMFMTGILTKFLKHSIVLTVQNSIVFTNYETKPRQT